MESNNETEDPDETRGIRDYCYEDFDASLSDETTNVATLSSCSTPSSMTASSRGPPSVACDEVRVNEDRDVGDDDDGAAGTSASDRLKHSSRRPAKRKKKDPVSSITSPVIPNESDKSSKCMLKHRVACHGADRISVPLMSVCQVVHIC